MARHYSTCTDASKGMSSPLTKRDISVTELAPNVIYALCADGQVLLP